MTHNKDEHSVDTLNKTYYADSPASTLPTSNITMLAVPKTWTRLVTTLCILLLMVVALVTLMVYFNYGSQKTNTDRILNLERKVQRAYDKLGVKEDN